MKLTTLLFSAATLLTATVFASPTPEAESAAAGAAAIGAAFSSVHKRYCCSPQDCRFPDSICNEAGYCCGKREAAPEADPEALGAMFNDLHKRYCCKQADCRFPDSICNEAGYCAKSCW